jgi:iron complex outermembrane receptor protein
MSKVLFKSMRGLVSTLVLIQAAPVFADAAVGSPSASADQADAGQGASAPARAAPKADEGSLSEVIVTARRVEERVQDVPISITVFNQQQLSNRNVVNASDLATYTPSLQSNNNFGNQNSAFAIRGFVQDIGTQPSVGVYFADVVAPRAASNNIPIGDGAGPGTFWDLQNVQVLKGPQGTLFGRNTTGGAILIVPQKPTAREEGYAEVSFGNFDMKRIQAVENLPVSDTVRLRVGVDHQSSAGYLDNDSGVGPPHLGDVDYTAVRASLVVDITPDIENYAIASFMKSDTFGDVQKLLGCNPTPSLTNFLGLLACGQLQQEQAKGAGFYTVQSQYPNPSTVLRQWQIIDTTTWHASDELTIKDIISYAQLTERYSTAIFGTNFYLAPGVPVDFANSTPLPGGDTADESTATNEIQFQGRALNDKLNWQAGAYAELVDPLSLVGSQSPVLLDCTDSATFQCTGPLGPGAGAINYTAAETAFRNFGVYDQDTYSLTDTLKLTGGLRYTWDHTRSDTVIKTYPIPQLGPLPYSCNNPDLSLPDCFAHYTERSSAPTWLIDLDYTPTEDVLAYLKYSRGYRAGGIVNNAPTGFTSYKPEKVNTYETGFKTSFHAPISGTFDVAAFYNDFSNQQLQVNLDPKPGEPVSPLSGILNAGKSRIWGMEVETSLLLFPGFELDGGYTYLNTKIKQIAQFQSPASSPYEIVAPATAGDPLILSPRNKFTATGTYTLPLGESIGKVSGSATYTYTSRMVTNYVDAQQTNPLITPLSVLPSLGLLNLNATWASIFNSPIDVSLFVTNVTDKQYLTFVAGLYPTTGFETGELGQPRMFGARIRYTW